MLYGDDQGAEEGIANEIDIVAAEKVQITKDLHECMEGLLSDKSGSDEKR